MYTQDSEGYSTLPPSVNQMSEVDPTVDPSVIYGNTEPIFEESQVFESPNTQMPARSQVVPMNSTYLPEQPPDHMPQVPESSAYEHQDTGEVYAPQQEQWQHVQGGGYHEELTGYPTYPPYYNTGEDTEQEQWEAKPATPSSPARETPEVFSCPHIRTTFCFGGQLVTVLPSNVGAGEPPVVEITSLRDTLTDEGTREFVAAVTESQGPFTPRETPKSSIVSFASSRAQHSREKQDALVRDGGSDSTLAMECCEDEVLFWEFLMLLCQQNGIVMPSDVADLLMKDRPLTFKSSMHLAQVESLDSLRQLLLSGRKKDALDFACSKSLWGHALMLASRMDDQSRTYVVNRFTASLMTTDPLNTFYTLLLGRTPSLVKPEGLSRAGDWRPHLSMILANKTTKLDSTAIVSLGDSLMAKKRLHAAHMCYYLADVHFGCYGDMDTRYSLLGVDHTQVPVGSYPRPQDLQKMEVFEYAMSLTKHDFALPFFQVFKLLYVLKLVEYGFPRRALKYCEQISHTVCKGVDKYIPVFLSSLADVSVRLHHYTADFDYVETELPSWLCQLQQSVSDILSTDYTPNPLSPSPAFSSVSQTYSNQGTQPQLVIGLQQDAPQLLAVPQVSVYARSSKDSLAPLGKANDGTRGAESPNIPPNGGGSLELEYYQTQRNQTVGTMEHQNPVSDAVSAGMQQYMPQDNPVPQENLVLQESGQPQVEQFPPEGDVPASTFSSGFPVQDGGGYYPTSATDQQQVQSGVVPGDSEVSGSDQIVVGSAQQEQVDGGAVMLGVDAGAAGGSGASGGAVGDGGYYGQQQYMPGEFNYI